MLGVTMQTMCAALAPATIAKLHDRLENDVRNSFIEASQRVYSQETQAL